MIRCNGQPASLSKQMKSCTSFNKFIRFIEPIDMTALGLRYDCAGRKIRFRWVKDTTSLGGRVNFVG